MSFPCRPGRIGFLFLGGAKRVAMARMLRKACEARGLQCDITAYETDTRCAIACEGQVVVGRRWADADIFEHLDETVRTHGIDIIIPFVDKAVEICAEYVRHHASVPVFAPLGEPEGVKRMFDKVAAAQLFESASLPVPQTWRGGDVTGTFIAKPRFGSASKGLVMIDSQDDLQQIASKLDDYLVQRRYDKRREITVDCYVETRTGRVSALSPRVRQEVSGGEVVRTTSIADSRIDAIVSAALQATGLRGAVTVQLIHDLDSDALMIMEINPRLGGGAVASVHAGADIPGMIVDDAMGKALKCAEPVAGVTTVRYLEDVVFMPDEK
ncbi:MAG: ATP-grasp domain-containing protein [Muribaculaceae bacterium]|nr:ATP-grasp domain-containing protein [Muribaculaceae bacterium]